MLSNVSRFYSLTIRICSDTIHITLHIHYTTARSCLTKTGNIYLPIHKDQNRIHKLPSKRNLKSHGYCCTKGTSVSSNRTKYQVNRLFAHRRTVPSEAEQVPMPRSASEGEQRGIRAPSDPIPRVPIAGKSSTETIPRNSQTSRTPTCSRRRIPRLYPA